MPLVAWPGTPATELIGELLRELAAQAPDRLIADRHAAQEHHLFDSAEAQRKAEVEQHTLGKDLGRKPMP
jgi:hypothetical protein